MKTRCKTIYPVVAAFCVASMCLSLSGCAGITDTSASAPVALHTAALQGSVFGGQQPIVGANVLLYAASTSGYGSNSTSLLTSAVTTDSTGSFNITSKYTCSAGQQIYIVAAGGNPGAGINNQAVIMAALGDCTTLTASRFIAMNEITTVAAAYALAPFMSNYSAVGSSLANTGGMMRAFASAAKLADVSRGSTPGPMLAVGAIAPTAEINTLADILAACV